MIAGLILAGGAGTRLGGVDKAFLRLDGQSLIERLLTRLAPQVDQIAISANGDAARFAEFNLAVLPDGGNFAGKGPLAGVAAGLAWAASIGAAGLLTVPVDTPFIPPDLCARLAAAPTTTSAPAVAVWQGRQHHLVALWPVGFLAELSTFLERPGAYKVRDALALGGARQISFDEPRDPFLNINTTADFLIAQDRLARATR